jgi:hypothetical protein
MINLDFVTEKEYYSILASGDYSYDEASKMFSRIVEAVISIKAPKVLANLIQVKGTPSTTERFFLVESFVKNLPRSVKIAFVFLPPLLDSQHFGETVAVNRGANVKAFETIAEAKTWLGIANYQAC